jgi:hypothetical protein
MRLRYNFRYIRTLLLIWGSLASCSAPLPGNAGVPKEVSDAMRPLYAVSIGGQGNRKALLGTSGSYTVTVRNVGMTPDTYTISATSKLGWADFSQLPQTTALAPNQSISFPVHVAVPLTGSIGQEEVITLLAQSHTSKKLRDSDTTRVTVVAELP